MRDVGFMSEIMSAVLEHLRWLQMYGFALPRAAWCSCSLRSMFFFVLQALAHKSPASGLPVFPDFRSYEHMYMMRHR